MKRKAIFNQNGLKRTTIVGGDSDGIIDFVNPKYKWSRTIWDIMQANTWFPSEADIAQDQSYFKDLSDSEKRAYKLVLAQLIANDSIQTNQLMDSINQFITDPLVNACLAQQAYQEANHSFSYAVMAEELFQGEEAKEVYTLHLENEALQEKNQAVADMYQSIYTDDPTTDDILLALAANNVLERLVFPGGFVTMWSFGNKKLIGTAKMISFIERDESKTHVPLFKNIFNEVVKENYGSVDDIPQNLKDNIVNMIFYMTDSEIKWMKYVTKDLLGFSDTAIENYIKDKANDVFNNLLHYKPFNVENNVLKQTIEKKYSLDSNIKTSFFEQKVADYSTGSIDLNF